MIGKTYDSQHPAPPTKTDARGRKRVDIWAIKEQIRNQPQPNPAPRLRQALVSGNIGGRVSVRTLENVKRLGIDNETPEQPAEEVYYVPWAPGMAVSKQTYDSAMAKERERQEQAQREANRKAQAEANHAAHEAARQRDRELLKREAERKTKETEESLSRQAVLQTVLALDITPEEMSVVGPRLRSQGTHLMPDVWSWEVEELRRKNVK